MKKGEVKKWRVTRVRAYKTKAHTQHEYISAAVVDVLKKTHFVAIERGRGDPDPIPLSDTNNNTDPQPYEAFSSSTSSLSSVSDILPTHLADDKISPMPSSGKWNENDDFICELELEKPLYLYELAILAMIVHEVNKKYLLVTNNCYHYAGTIMRVLGEEYGTMNTTDGARAGKWCGIDIYSTNKGNITSLIEKLKNVVREFVGFILISNN